MKNIMFALVVLSLSLGSMFAAEQKIGDRVKVGGDVIVKKGETVKDATAVMGNVIVDGTVEGKATAVFGKVSVGPDGVVKGDAVSIHNNVDLANGAKVFGNITQVNPGGICSPATFFTGILGFFGLIKIIIMLGFLALAALFVAVFPGYAEACISKTEQGVLKPFLIGILGTVLIIPVGIALVVSIVGILFIPLEIIFVFVALLAGYVLAGAYIGKKFIAAFGKNGLLPVWNTLIGIALLWIIGFVPFAGVFVNILVFTLGFGIVLVSLIRIGKNS